MLKACIRTLECTENNFTDLIVFPANDNSMEADNFRRKVEEVTWSNFFLSEKDTWINRFLQHRFLQHGDPGDGMLVIRAIKRANEVDKHWHSKRPNILFYLIKNMSDDLFGTSTKK